MFWLWFTIKFACCNKITENIENLCTEFLPPRGRMSSRLPPQYGPSPAASNGCLLASQPAGVFPRAFLFWIAPRAASTRSFLPYSRSGMIPVPTPVGGGGSGSSDDDGVCARPYSHRVWVRVFATMRVCVCVCVSVLRKRKNEERAVGPAAAAAPWGGCAALMQTRERDGARRRKRESVVISGRGRGDVCDSNDGQVTPPLNLYLRVKQ